MTNKHYFPALTFGFGGIGLILRIWLYSNRDALGLLPANHISSYLTLGLTALFLILIFISARRTPLDETTCAPSPVFSGLGNLIFAAGILQCTLREFLAGHEGLNRLFLPVGLIAAVALVVSGIGYLAGKQNGFISYCIATVYLVLHVISQCRAWGTEPQVGIYCFHLLCAISLMITCYHRAALSTGKGTYRRFLFFSQATIFFCCLVLNADDRLFYIAAMLWLILDSPKLAE